MWQKKYDEWQNFNGLESSLKKELLSMTDLERQDAFYKDVEFGTGGMRGIIGVGTNRLNIYTVRRATAGLAKVVKSDVNRDRDKGVVIAFDSRHQSVEFAREAARVLGSSGIPVFLFNSLRPTPVLSYAVRRLQALYGIVITASHNPAKYNGYKLYNEHGGQLVPEEVAPIITAINETHNSLTMKLCDFKTLKQTGMIRDVPGMIDQDYINKVSGLSLQKKLIETNSNALQIVYTPLHGTAAIPLPAALRESGFSKVHIVQAQANPDPDFSTVKSPNPENHDALIMAENEAVQINADIILATDPDSDRLGVAALNDAGEYKAFSGNQIAALLVDYLIKHRSLSEDEYLVTTIVSSDFAADIADKFGIAVKKTLTGFKYIGEAIQCLDGHFFFGYEESYGYLLDTFTRDKDAIQPAVMIAEIALAYKLKGKSLWNVLNELYQEYGYYGEKLVSEELDGIDGQAQIKVLMQQLRDNPLSQVGRHKVKEIMDFQQQKVWNQKQQLIRKLELPVSDVLKYTFEDGYWFAVRPSGTEPKIKLYFGSKETSEVLAHSEMDRFVCEVKKLVLMGE